MNRHYHPLRLVGMLLAVALVYTAQFLFSPAPLPWEQIPLSWLSVPFKLPSLLPTARLALGGVGVAMGALIFGISALGPLTTESLEGSTPTDQGNPSTSAWHPRLWLLIITALAYGFSLGAFEGGGDQPLVAWVWGIVLIALLMAFWSPRETWEGLCRWQLPQVSWPAILPLLILLAAAFLRLDRLAIIPYDVHGDMASHGLQARAILNGQDQGIFHVGWYTIPMMGFVPAALTMRLFGDNLVGLRLASVIGGLFSIWGSYLLAREFASKRVALMTMWLLTITVAHIHFSRIAEYMDPVPFAVWGTYAFVRGLRSRRPLPFAWAGILFGVGVQLYFAGRVIPVIIGLFGLYLLLFHRRWISENWQGLGLLIVAFLLTLGPLLLYFAHHPDDLISRPREVFLFYPAVMEHLMNKYGVSSVDAVVREQVRRSLLMFHVYGDTSTQFGWPGPMLNPYIAPLLALGVGYVLLRLHRAGNALGLIWLTCLVVIGSILTNNAPFWPRLVLVTPVAAFLIAVGLDRLWESVDDIVGPIIGRSFGMLVVGSLIFVGIYNWADYVDVVKDNAMPRARIGRYAASLPQDTTLCVVEGRWRADEREIAFLRGPRPGLTIAPGDWNACTGSVRAYVLAPEQRQLLTNLQTRVPGGRIEEHRDFNGTLIFVAYRLP